MADIARTSAPNVNVRRRRTGLCGIASILLLGASFKWAHHWGARADLIVAAWAVATAVAFIGGLRLHIALGEKSIGRFAKFGFALAAISVGALIVTGIAFAAGSDPAGACGGG